MATKAASKSTAVAKRANTSVANIQEMLKAQAAAMANRIAPPTGNKIKVTQDKKFMLPDGSRSEGPLDLVVVDFVSRNEYYEGSYDPNNIVSPVCFAIGPEPKSLAPSANSPDKQCDDCASCPMNQFGSAGKGKACKNSRLLAVLQPDAEEDTPIWLLQVSPTALKAFDGFVGNVNRAFGMPPISVVVEVGFNDGETFPSLTFSNPRPNENLAVHFARQAEASELLAVEPDVNRQPAVPAAPARGARPVARKPAVGARR